MSYLLGSNIVSELRKRERANGGVQEWFADVDDAELFLSVLTLGELRRGIEAIHHRDRPHALVLNRWFHALVTEYEERILIVDRKVAEQWGRMNAAATLPAIDGLLAATAYIHDLTLVTRNTKDLTRSGVPCLNPFKP